ncbi:putative cellulose binding protein [Chaetomidium leptoderma]|uniref:Carboxylic ester hydrolase n=1 Tax=Chaetomidium leptoderma TaxID=669021 RepID=A0AAN6ZYY8_9PEZI|nr:putative cellulose binding protein [Chaetomidium leptoderma]
MKAPTTLSLGLCLLLPSLTAAAATLTQITTPFGPNPRNVSFHIYVPDTLPDNPAILVNPHWCHGTAQATFAGTQWAALAREHGFIVIYPGSPNAADQCWDVSSPETLTHDDGGGGGGGDSLGIVSMVRWTLDQYQGDKGRVFVTGVSSGGMMTQVLVGAYPDVFAAGAAFAGVPFGCFAPPAGDNGNAGQFDYWSDDCATGKVTHSAEAWGDLVRAAYPGYDGWRPKLQLFHGTVDEIVSYVNHGEAVKLWTDVSGLSETPVEVVQNTPLTGWTKSVYGPSGWLEAYSAAGVPHDIKVQENTVMAFFDLNCTSNCFSWGQGGPSSGGQPNPSSTFSTITSSVAPISTTSSSTVVVPTTTSAAACPTSTIPGAQKPWGQCGGRGYSGPTVCSVGVCTRYSDYFSQVKSSHHLLVTQGTSHVLNDTWRAVITN